VSATAEPQTTARPLAESANARRLVDLVFRLREFGIVAVLALLVLVTAAIEPRFLNLSNIQFILVDATIFALLALGETMVVLTRNVDLSIGSVLGLCAFLSADLFGHHHGISIVLVFVVGCAIGIACGLVNGFLTVVGRVPSLVVTLAMLYIIRGVDTLVVGGGQVVASSVPNAFLEIPRKTVAGIPILAIVVAGVVAVGAYYLRSFRSGRELYAIGSNPDAARLAGIPAGRRVFTAFVICGGIAGIAGVLYAARYGTIDSTAGSGYELSVIAAVVVGGVAIFGGSGSAVGAAFGALLLNTILSALYVLGVSPFWNQAIAGGLLLGAIALDRGISLQLAAALRKRRTHLGA
jgi:rhamnose transport system permease protein